MRTLHAICRFCNARTKRTEQEDDLQVFAEEWIKVHTPCAGLSPTEVFIEGDLMRATFPSGVDHSLEERPTFSPGMVS